jgi:beta-D-xylosidase 4
LKVNALLWGGYPGQSGGDALFNTITGKAAPAGRLPTTQYPADYADQVDMTNMELRPGDKNPGRTYIWYTGEAVYPFGSGLHYTTFAFSWLSKPAASYDIADLVQHEDENGFLDLKEFASFEIDVENTGEIASDYVALLFISGKDSGPAPQPLKRLVAYTRVKQVQPGKKSTGDLTIKLGSLTRADEEGDQWVYPGKYALHLDTNPVVLTAEFELVGEAVRILSLPKDHSKL